MDNDDELAVACRVARKNDRLYWVDGAGVWESQHEDGEPTGEPELVLRHGLPLEPGFVYYLDVEGDIRRVPSEADEQRKLVPPRYWVVKGSPRENDLEEMLQAGKVETWRTKKPPKAWAAGDRLFFWKSSPGLFLVGVGELATLRDWSTPGFLFDVRYLTRPLDEMLSQAALRAVPELREASFLKAGPAGTVFPLTDEQAHLLVAAMQRANPEVKTLQRWLADLGGPIDIEDPLSQAIAASPNFFAEKGIRTLSVRQPWAWAILHAGKNIENRSQRTNVRGTIALHASQSRPDPEALAYLWKGYRLRPPDDLPLGAVVGVVDIVECSEDASSRWAEEGCFHWALGNPVPFAEPRPATGKVGFWYWLP